MREDSQEGSEQPIRLLTKYRGQEASLSDRRPGCQSAALWRPERKSRRGGCSAALAPRPFLGDGGCSPALTVKNCKPFQARVRGHILSVPPLSLVPRYRRIFGTFETRVTNSIDTGPLKLNCIVYIIQLWQADKGLWMAN